LRSFRYACAAQRLSNGDARKVLAQIIETVTADLDHARFPVPTEAPEFWESRIGRKENPPVFIRRVYAQYLHGGFTRAMLRNLDQPLYQALAVWEGRHPEDQLHEMPKRFVRTRNGASVPVLK